jgi:hypothetical protein
VVSGGVNVLCISEAGRSVKQRTSFPYSEEDNGPTNHTKYHEAFFRLVNFCGSSYNRVDFAQPTDVAIVAASSTNKKGTPPVKGEAPQAIKSFLEIYLATLETLATLAISLGLSEVASALIGAPLLVSRG